MRNYIAGRFSRAEYKLRRSEVIDVIVGIASDTTNPYAADKTSNAVDDNDITQPNRFARVTTIPHKPPGPPAGNYDSFEIEDVAQAQEARLEESARASAVAPELDSSMSEAVKETFAKPFSPTAVIPDTKPEQPGTSTVTTAINIQPSANYKILAAGVGAVVVLLIGVLFSGEEAVDSGNVQLSAPAEDGSPLISQINIILESIAANNQWEYQQVEAFWQAWQGLSPGQQSVIKLQPDYQAFLLSVKSRYQRDLALAGNNDAKLAQQLALLRSMAPELGLSLDTMAVDRVESYASNASASLPPVRSPLGSEARRNLSATLLAEFVGAYEQTYKRGEVEILAAMFTNNASFNDVRGNDAIYRKMQEQLQQRTQASVALQDLNWQRDVDTASASGLYVDQYKNEQGELIEIKAPLDLEVVDTDQGLLISMMKLGDPLPQAKVAKVAKVKISPLKEENGKEKTGSDESKPVTPGQVALSVDELDALIVSLARRYQKGDINGFMALFQNGARTNERMSKMAIRKDYTSLFETTSSRQMIIKDMKWKIGEDNNAKGRGDFVVLVQPKGGAESVVKGTIGVMASKTEDGLQISVLQHNIH